MTLPTNSCGEPILDALPFREARQPKSSQFNFPAIYGWDSVPSTPTAGGAESSSNLAQVLQSTLKEASDSVGEARKQLADLQAVQSQLLASTNQNTQALNANTTAKSGGGGSSLSAIGNVASGIFGKGSLVSPIASELIGLFGGDTSSPQQFFTPFVMPPSLRLETIVNAPAPAATPANSSVPQNPAQAAPASGPTVHIQVSAMDSRSFLDHSGDIAEAVRQALLNSHALSDVIAEM